MPITRTELLDILRNGENSAVEFKRDDITVEQLAKELVAFSNFEGGMVQRNNAAQIGRMGNDRLPG
jgi:ATP-dependent DNA helicase RecG